MQEPQSKVCRECQIEKDIEEFAPNQYGKNNRILRRPVCRECYAKKVKANPQQKREFVAKYPRPEIGEVFDCPICLKKIVREHNNDVVLDHSHEDGSIRGWLCSSCNTSLGKFNDDPEILERAKAWIEKHKNRN